MTATEDRARAAMRAIAGTVDGAPPLSLRAAPDSAPGLGEPRAHGHGHGSGSGSGARRRSRDGNGRRRWSSVLAPVAAAAVIAAVAVALVLVRNIPNGGVAAPVPPAASTSPGNVPRAGTPPEYYVTWMQADTPYLIVGNTRTGKTVATVQAPAGVRLDAVYGADADDRTFVVTAERVPAAHTVTVWYLLRISPGGSPVARFTPLPVPVSQSPAGVTLSPDGTELAVALPGSPATLRVYSVAAGTLLRSWTAEAGGEITVDKAIASDWPLTAMTLRWSADGRQLAFAWNGGSIRELAAAAADGDLIAGSSPLAVIGKTYDTGGYFTCDPTHGWQLIEGGQGVVCAGGETSQLSHICPATGKCTSAPQAPSIGFMRQTSISGGGTETELLSGEFTSAAQSQGFDGAYLGWANGDGSVLIGTLVADGKSRFGIFHGKDFTALPGLPTSLPVPAGSEVLQGTYVW